MQHHAEAVAVLAAAAAVAVDSVADSDCDYIFCGWARCDCNFDSSLGSGSRRPRAPLGGHLAGALAQVNGYLEAPECAGVALLVLLRCAASQQTADQDLGTTF